MSFEVRENFSKVVALDCMPACGLLTTVTLTKLFGMHRSLRLSCDNTKYYTWSGSFMF